MLTAEGVVGKAVLALVGKLSSALVSLAMDKRKKACKALTKLYYAMQLLDEVTDRFLSEFAAAPQTGDARAFIACLVREERSIELSTNAFVDLSFELQRGLEILDPPLADCCQILYYGKADFLSFLSNSIEVRFQDQSASVTVCTPNDRILATDFDEVYRQSSEARAHGARYYWPSGTFDYLNDFEEVVVRFEDDATAAKLISMIQRQNQVLKQAKEQLRALIKNSFSVEEILFHKELTPR
jgi:hypothetical protein